MALVDVVIVNYNAGPHLAKVIQSLQIQTFRDFRILVVDNGSTDGSLEGLAPGAIPLEIVPAGRNLGFAAGNNLAIRRHVSAEWLALLNPDAFPHPDWLQELMAAAAAHTDYQFFGCRMLDATDPTRLDGVGDVYHVSGLYWREGHGRRDGPVHRTSKEIFSPCAAAALYRTEDVLEIGGFDEDFFCYGEDVDLAFRLRLAGRRCLYVAESVVEHMGSGIVGLRSDFQLYHGHRNLFWVYVKNMPGWLFWAYLPYHLILNLYSLFIFTIRGRGRPLWRAKLDALRGLGCAWAKRRQIQARRVVSTSALRALMRGGLPGDRGSG
jgi:GT2 family glycosyltransferase